MADKERHLDASEACPTKIRIGEDEIIDKARQSPAWRWRAGVDSRPVTVVIDQRGGAHAFLALLGTLVAVLAGIAGAVTADAAVGRASAAVLVAVADIVAAEWASTAILRAAITIFALRCAAVAVAAERTHAAILRAAITILANRCAADVVAASLWTAILRAVAGVLVVIAHAVGAIEIRAPNLEVHRLELQAIGSTEVPG